MTHDEISILAGKWLKNHPQNLVVPNCPQIAIDLVTNTLTGEIPDVIGFCSFSSVLIEVKVSRADFLKDKKKIFRKKPSKGMGQLRLYACPEGLIKESELPENWGLLYVNRNNKIDLVVIPSNQKANLSCERTVLVSMLRRKKH